MNNILKTKKRSDILRTYDTHEIRSVEENVVESYDPTTGGYNINGVTLKHVNFNDIQNEDEECEYETDETDRNTRNNKKKKKKKIEYVFYDVESLNDDRQNSNNIIDLSSIKTEMIFEKNDNKKKNTKKGKAKKKIKNFKKKYKILPEHNLDNDNIYEESLGDSGVLSTTKKKTRKKKTKVDNAIEEVKSKETHGWDNQVFLNVLKMVILISSIYSLGAFSTTVTKYIFYVEKLNYAHFIAGFQFFIMYITLRLVLFIFKIETSTKLTKKNYIKYIISIAALLGVDTVAGSSCYSYLEIPIITVIKSSSIILIYFLSVKFGLRKLQCSLLCSILTILAGTLMSASTLKMDSAYGLFLLILAVVSGSFKWVFTNLLLRMTSIKPHVILIHVYRAAFLIIIIPCIIIDFSKMINDYKQDIITHEKILTTFFLLTLGSLTSIFFILAELMLISFTSSVTLGIVGIGREAVMLIIGAVFFGEKFGLSSAIGIVISMIGTVMYAYVSQ